MKYLPSFYAGVLSGHTCCGGRILRRHTFVGLHEQRWTISDMLCRHSACDFSDYGALSERGWLLSVFHCTGLPASGGLLHIGVDGNCVQEIEDTVGHGDVDSPGRAYLSDLYVLCCRERRKTKMARSI